MTRTAPREDRPTPVFRECDGAPWPSDDELEQDAAWAALRESGDIECGTGDEPQPQDGVSSAAGRGGPRRVMAEADLFDDEALWELEELARPVEAGAATVSDLDARLGHLECATRERQRATAEEYRLILTILDDAVFDPTPWVGPDPTLDRAWHDPRGRTSDAVRRDRVDLAERAAVAEIAVRLHLSEQTVRVRAAHARTLITGCPRLWAAFGEGELSERHAIDAARMASTLPAGDTEAFRRFDDEVFSLAVALTPAKFAVAARAVRERVHAESLKARHRRAAEDRGVWMTAELDGMASVHALLPADRAHAVMSRLDRAARHLRTAVDEERTLSQLRADAFVDLVTMVDDTVASGAHAHVAPGAATPRPPASSAKTPVAGTSTAGAQTPAAPNTPSEGSDPARTASEAQPTFRAAPPATVVVTVPALTLLGHGTEPATLEGYGPIDLDTARRLAGTATSWIRLLTHPVTGAPLVLDRTTYRVPVALRRWLGVTSPTCVFPGCARAARNCDIDHLTAWGDGGATDDDNLDPKCRHHHRLRHESRWQIEPEPGGTAWISPLGGRYGADPPPF